MKKRRPGPYTCIGVDLLGHPRAHAAGAAMLTWFWANLFTKWQKLDGFISDVAITLLPPPANNPEWAKRLGDPDVALFERDDERCGWVILRFDVWNLTAKQEDKARKANVRRVNEFRNALRNASVPMSSSPSTSSSDSDQGGAGGTGAASGTLTPPPSDIPITEEIRAQCAMAGARPPAPEHVAACLANARSKSHISADWGAVLVAWMIRQKGFDARGGGARPAGGIPKQAAAADADFMRDDWTGPGGTTP